MAFFPALKAWLSCSIVSRYVVCLERIYFVVVVVVVVVVDRNEDPLDVQKS